MWGKKVMLATGLAILIAGSATAGGMAVDQPGLYIISPADGSHLRSPITVRFGLSGFGVAPAGIDKPRTGHHHLLIDAPLPALNQPIPSDANHRHFGGGQTEAAIELPPGQHTLQLMLGNYAHIPHQPPLVSPVVTVTVE